MRDLERAQDGTEVKAWELQLLTDRAHNLGDRSDAFETMRDLAADAYRVETGNTLASAPRIAYEPDRQAHLGRHRRPRLRPRPQGPRNPLALARGNPGRVTADSVRRSTY